MTNVFENSNEYEYLKKDICDFINYIYSVVCNYIGLDSSKDSYELQINDLDGDIKAQLHIPDQLSAGKLIIAKKLICKIDELYQLYIFKNNISLPTNYLLYNNLFLLIHCIAHELHHRYKYSINTNSFTDYISSDANYNNYRLQNVEIEANNFGDFFTRKILFDLDHKFIVNPLLIFLREYKKNALGLLRF